MGNKVLTVFTLFVGVSRVIKCLIGEFVEVILTPEFLLLYFIDINFHPGDTCHFLVSVVRYHVKGLFPLFAFHVD